KNVTCSLNLSRIHGAHHQEQDGESTRVVADTRSSQFRAVPANFDIGPFGKHRIEMGSDRYQRSSSGSFANSNDISFGVYIHVRQPALAQHLGKRFGSLFLLEGRSFDFGNLHDFTHETIMIFSDEIFGSLKFWVRKYALRGGALAKNGDGAHGQGEQHATPDLRKQLYLRRSLRRPYL